LRTDYYKQYYERSSFLFGESVQTLICVSSVLAFCMTILLAGGKWHQSEPEAGQLDYQGDLKSALKMVSACVLFVFSFLIWVIVPLHERMNGVVELLK